MRSDANDADQNHSRQKEAVAAFLQALHDGYPSWYRKYCGRSPLFACHFPKELDGRLIKLRRLCLARLAEYM